MIALSAFALTLTSPPDRTRLSSIFANASPRTMLSALAPAPLTATAFAPPASATVAAPALTRMIDDDSPRTVTAPRASSSAPSMPAWITPSMTFFARVTPMVTATPVLPKAAAMLAAPAKATMADTSVVRMSMFSAMIRLGRAPTVVAAVATPDCTRAPIWFSAQTPEPLTATPDCPAAIAADPANTAALMICVVDAPILRSP